MHFDLGVMMNRHSTLASWLYLLLAAVCGRLCVPGGNVIPGVVHPMGFHSEDGHPDNWRTLATDFPAIMGFHPPNVLPEEILSEHPRRIRALINSSSNPLRSYADTTAFENAFERLELLVTVEVAMTETAEMSDYVLPGRTAYECHDTTFFAFNYPEVYLQMRQPVVTPHPDTRENGEIFIGIAEHAGVMPKIPDWLYQAAEKGLDDYVAALGAFFVKTRTPIPILPLVLGKTLGPQLGSVNLATLWGHLFSAPRGFRKHTAGAGYPMPSVIETLRMPGKLSKAFFGTFRYLNPGAFAVLAPQAAHAKILYEAAMAHPGGMWIGKVDPEKNMAQVRTPDKKIQLFDPQMSSWLQEVTPDIEKNALELSAEFPLVLHAGRHKPENANNIMRNPAWNNGRRTCTLAMNPIDASKLGLSDKEIARVVTEAGSEELEVEVTEDVRAGQVLVPHGFGLKYKGEIHGINVNRLCRNTHRDRIAATPLHRFVPCRVEKVGN
jgi:anaerobic selenocysteine-containing dehydrogenase